MRLKQRFNTSKLDQFLMQWKAKAISDVENDHPWDIGKH